MLQLQQISKTYRGKADPIKVLHGVDLTVEKGQFMALQGSSGCGKTTLLFTCGGLLSPDSGTVTVAGKNLYSMGPNSRAAFRAHNIGFVFQRFHLIPYLNLVENVLSASLPHHKLMLHDRAHELIERFGLMDRIGHYPSELSAGECQRAGLARALLNSPELVLADEPTGNLDPESSEIVLSELSSYASGGAAVLMATHDKEAASRAHETYSM